MADVKISGLPASTTPLTGTEVLPVVQGGVTKQVSVDNLTAGKAVSATTMTLANNLAFSGTGNRITGDFSGSPITNRVGFQSSTTNGNTSFFVMPNGSAVLSAINFTNSSDITNASSVLLRINATSADLISTQIGTGTYLPITIQAGGAERLRVFTSGGVSIGNSTDPGATNLSVTGSVIPNAVPSSKWGIDFAPSTSAGSYVSIANDATYALASGSGVFYLYENGGNGAGGFYSFYGSPVIAWQSGASFSVNTPGQAATINIYFSANNYIIENKFGSTLNFFISTIRLRTAS